MILIRIHIRLGEAFKGRGSHTLHSEGGGSREAERTLIYNPSCHVHDVEANRHEFPSHCAEEWELGSPVWPAWVKSSSAGVSGVF